MYYTSSPHAWFQIANNKSPKISRRGIENAAKPSRDSSALAAGYCESKTELKVFCGEKWKSRMGRAAIRRRLEGTVGNYRRLNIFFNMSVAAELESIESAD
jgi:hypothetical protein